MMGACMGEAELEGQIRTKKQRRASRRFSALPQNRLNLRSEAEAVEILGLNGDDYKFVCKEGTKDQLVEMLSNAKYEQMDLWDRRQLDSDLQARIEEKTDFDEAYEFLWKRYIAKSSKATEGNDKRSDFMFMTGLALDKDEKLKTQTENIISSFKDLTASKKSSTAKKWGAMASKAKNQEDDDSDAVFTRKTAADLIAGQSEGKTSLSQVFTMKTIAKKWTKSSLKKGEQEDKKPDPEALISNAMEAAKLNKPLHGNTLNLPDPDKVKKREKGEKKEKKKYQKAKNDKKRHSTAAAFAGGSSNELAPDDGLGLMSNKSWRRHSFKRPASSRDPDTDKAFERRSFRKTKKSFS